MSTGKPQLLVAQTMLAATIMSAFLVVAVVFPSLDSKPPVEVDYRTPQEVLMNQDSLDIMYEREVKPIEEQLMTFPNIKDTTIVRQIAWSVHRAAKRERINPFFITAIMRIENPWLDPEAESYAGAVGLMQVMPKYWLHEFPSCGVDLTSIETNICKGTKIAKSLIDRELEYAVDKALLAYNGCVNTPGCEVYSDNVLSNFQVESSMDEIWTNE